METKFCAISWKELMEMEFKPECVDSEECYRFLMRNGTPYKIEKSRVKNDKDINRWAEHLLPKNWVTKQMVIDFIRLAKKNLEAKKD